MSSQNANIQLFQYAHNKFGDFMLANDPRLISKSKEYESNLMESVAVIKIAVGVKKAELMSFHRDHDEPFRIFAYSF